MGREREIAASVHRDAKLVADCGRLKDTRQLAGTCLTHTESIQYYDTFKGFVFRVVTRHLCDSTVVLWETLDTESRKWLPSTKGNIESLIEKKGNK